MESPRTKAVDALLIKIISFQYLKMIFICHHFVLYE